MDEKQTDALVVIAFTTGHKSYSRGAIAPFPADRFAELKEAGFVTEAPEPEPEEESGRPPAAEGDASANAAGGGMPGGLVAEGEAAAPATEKGGKRR